MKRHVVAAALLAASCTGSPPTPEPLALVPLPASVETTGARFAPGDGMTVSAPSADLAAVAREVVAGTGGPAVTPADDGASIHLAFDPSLPAEGYRLTVSEEGVRIEGGDEAGLFYGLQTLRQLAGPGPDGWSVPGVRIQDAPRFPYRGLHLDVGRHFFPVSFIKAYLDRMAELKLNRFHWGLTQDQGWRAEIRAYPRLTEVASCRRETILDKQFDPYVGDGTPHCGYYTQDEMREVVAYAAARHIMVIPEVNMPGHSVAALAAYPELGCTDEPREVSTVWGIHDDILCPSERTFTFLEGVLTEIMDVFPSPFIHVGGDEVPKKRWEESPLAQEIIRREDLGDESGLQSWFVHRIDSFLTAHGRRLIGWDEILEGGLAPNATVMSWRGTEGGIAAARQGHDVIMTPTRHLYLDFYQGPQDAEPIAADWSGYPLPLEQVYAFDPVPSELTPVEARHVLGAQGNVWTEYMKTPEKVEYMVFPRALALAEMVWTPQERRDWDGFVARLPERVLDLRARGVNVRIPDFMR